LDSPVIDGYSAINQDVNHFSGLSRYQKANLELPSSNAKRIVFFGDSINRSLEPSRTFPKPAVHQSRHNSPDHLPDAVALPSRCDRFAPATVVILAGINDLAGHTGKVSLEQIEANHAAMAEMSGSNHIRTFGDRALSCRSRFGKRVGG